MGQHDSKPPTYGTPIPPEDEIAALRRIEKQVPQFSLSYLRTHPDCVMLLAPSGRLTFISEKGRQVLGARDMSQLAGRDWAEFWPEDSRAMIRAATESAADRNVVQFEASCPAPDGQPRWFAVTVTPLVNADGEVESLLTVARDTTARHAGAGEGRDVP